MQSNTAKFRLFLFLWVCFFIYSGFVYTSGTERELGQLSSEARAGLQVWQDHNCTSCHQIYGLGGYRGPELTNVISTKGEAYARIIMQNGTEMMPNFELSEQELDNLIAFFAAVDESGKSPARNFESTWYGTVNYGE